MSDRPPLLLLIDGHALVFVAYYALKEPMTVRSTGEPIGAVYGFLNSFIKTVADFKPTHCVVAFDPPGPTFRHDHYDEYKAHRPPTPPDLPGQIERIKQMLGTFDIPIVEAPGFEGDDVLGTLSAQSEAQGMDTLILTVDTDALQLVTPHTRVYVSTAFNRKVYDVAAVEARYDGLGPDRVADIKGLEGDTSDNIPGVRGVGRKTAIKLLTQFGTVEGIYQHIDEVAPAGLQTKMRDAEAAALDSKYLTTIVRDVPVTLDVEAADFSTYDRPAVAEFLRGLDFRTIIDRLPVLGGMGGGDGSGPAQSSAPAPGAVVTDYRIVDTPEKLDAMIAELSASEAIAFDTETTSQHAMLAELVGLSFSNADGVGWYVPVGHAAKLEIELGETPEVITQVPMQEALDALRPLFESETTGKMAHNANYDVTVLANHGVEVRNLTFDTMLAAHLTGRRAIGLKTLALELLGEEMTPIKDLIGTGKKQITMAQVSIEKAAPYAAADADFTHRLHAIFSEDLDRMDLAGPLKTVEMPLVHVLVRMQRNGVAINSDMLGEMSVGLGKRLDEVERSMYELIGHEFKIGSSLQLGEVLFNELKLPPLRKTKSGYSTDAASLDALKEQLDSGKLENVDPRAYDVIDRVLEFREVSKLKSTYVDALPGLVNPKTGRIHTSYNQTGSATGRVSSNDPNVQNIPVRTELGRRVRRAFVPNDSPDWMLLGADYSQIELRILAHMSEDADLLKAFHDGLDIHSATSSLVYEVPIDQVTPDMRRVAKVLNFGVLYGLTPFGIIQQTDLTAEQGRQFIDAYFASYPGIKGYIDATIASCQQAGYVASLGGRRRYLPEINSSNRQARSAAERAAINMPVQGTAADIIKLAMLRMQGRLDEAGMRTRMILQVHDELVFECPADESDALADLLRVEMPAAMELKVPLEIEVKAGPNWDQMVPLG
jgi:DNA polymerase-1